jgi:Holliday junction resolvase YEN1
MLASGMAYQGQEKTIFYRICRLLTLNIQLIFVFDGPGRPWKRGKRGQGKIDYRERDLLKEVLRSFGIPFHEAPGEAEAECTRLQILGLVDAVWSQDSDCLMFGCTLWIRDDRVVKEKGLKDLSKENTQKSKKTARVVRAQDLRANLHLDREALVLFAMLVGGDYDTQGLPGCGPSMAMKAVRKGLGQSLCESRNQRDCDEWSMCLAECLPRSIAVPTGFPDFKTLVKYNSPKVTADEVLRNNARLNLDFVRPINELKLLEVTSSRFNIWGRLYMNWVGPVLLTRLMSSGISVLPPELVSSIKFVKQKVEQTEEGLPVRVLERKLGFSPFGVTSFRKEDFEGERLGYWNGDRNIMFDPNYRVEKVEMPNYWLQKTLPQDVLEPPAAAPKGRTAKRKQDAEASEPASDPTEPVNESKRRRKAVKQAATVRQSPSSTSGVGSCWTPAKQRYQKLSRDANLDIIELSDSEKELRLPPSRLPMRSSAKSAASEIVEFGSPSSSDGEPDELGQIGSRKPAEIQTPSAALFVNAEENEERELELALRLSIQEQTAVSSTGRNSGLSFDEAKIDALPTRSTHPWSITPARKTRFEASKVSVETRLERFGSSRQTTHDAATFGQGDLEARRKSSPRSSLASLHLAYTSVFASKDPRLCCLVTEDLSAENTDPITPSLQDVRAARLRRFHFSCAARADFESLSNSPQESARSIRQSRATFLVPAGTDCIDLTDD